MITLASTIKLGLILGNVALVSGAQLLLKIGTIKIESTIVKNHFLMSVVKTVLNPYIFLGISCYVISLVLWIYILTKVELSIAYPMMSLSYIVVMILSVFLINETINLLQWSGVLLIVVGTSLIFLFK